MEIVKYTRKPFPVNVVQVTLKNVEEVATWCRGIVQMVPTRILGTETELPAIKIQGQGDNRGKESTATLGCYVVEQKGSFRVYKPSQFEASFDELPEPDEQLEKDVQTALQELDEHMSSAHELNEAS